MKKIFLFIIVGLLLINFSSAGLFDPGSELAFHEEGKNGKGGYYEINDTDFWFFNNKPIKTIELIENDYSVYTAWNIKEIEVFRPTKLFDKTNYLDKAQKEDRKNLLSSELHLFREWETKTRTINNQSCLTYETTANQTQICSEYQDNSYEEEYEEWSDWKLYNFQTVQEGLYQTKTIVTRNRQNTGVIDWVDKNEGWDLSEWATWWDNDWNKKRVINFTSNIGNFSYIETIPYNSSMQTDFDDLRFLDFATESIELNYTIESFVASTSAQVRIYSKGDGTVVMYYGNAGVSSTSSSYDMHFQPLRFFFLDKTSGAVIDSTDAANGTNNGATRGVTGIINNSLDFTQTNSEYVDLGSSFTLTGGYTGGAWINPKSNTGNQDFLSKFTGGNDGVLLYTTASSNIVFSYFIGGVNKQVIYNYGSSLAAAGDIHVIATFDGTDGKLYVDSILRGTTNSPGTLTITANNFNIGRRPDGTNYFDGTIDEVPIYPRGISQEEVIRLFTYTEPSYIIGEEQINLGVSTTLISPENNENILNNTVNFNFTSIPTQTNLTNATLYIWMSNGTLVDTNFTTLSGNESVNTTLINTLEDGMYKWNAETCGESVGCSFANSNNSFIVHVTPLTINILEPNETIEFIKIGNNETLSWIISEPGENLTEHVTNCSLTYNSVITYLPLNTCIVTNTTEFIYVLGVDNLTFNTTDKFNLTSSKITTWEYTITEINQTFENQTTEGSTQDISALIQLIDGETISAAILNYNGSLSAGTTSISGDNIIILESGFATPSVEADENITFQWSIVLSGGETINLSEQNQTIINMGADNCSTFTNKILSMTIVDEKIQTPIANTTLEIALNIFSLDRTTEVVDFSGEFDSNPVEVCLNINLSEGTSYSLDSIIRYTATAYANEYYNIVDFTLDNNSGTQNLTLYDLNTTDSTDFQLTFTGEDFLPVENALVSVERQYISENTFKTVELPKTDSNGQTILHLVRNDVIYNILVMKDGEVLGNFQNVIAFCEDFAIGACSLPLNAISNISLVFDYDDEIGLIFQENTQYNATTGVASFSFASVDGTTKVVNMIIERRDVFGNRTICENTVVSSTGTVSCQVDTGIDDTTLISIISVDGEVKLNSEIILDSSAYGQNGYAMFFLFSIAMLLMFSGSKTWTLVGVALNYIIGVSLGVIVGGIAGVGSTGIFVLVISMVGIWQLNKGRKQ